MVRRYVREMREDGWIMRLDPDDWTIVNTERDGGPRHYGVKLWSGAGYMLSPYSVWADNEMDALTIVAEWCADHEPGMIVTAKEVHEQMEENMAEVIRKNPRRFGMSDAVEDMSDKDICDRLFKEDRNSYWELYEKVWNDEYMYEWVTETENPDIYVRSENMWVSPWPDDYPSPGMRHEHRSYSREALFSTAKVDDNVMKELAKEIMKQIKSNSEVKRIPRVLFNNGVIRTVVTVLGTSKDKDDNNEYGWKLNLGLSPSKDEKYINVILNGKQETVKLGGFFTDANLKKGTTREAMQSVIAQIAKVVKKQLEKYYKRDWNIKRFDFGDVEKLNGVKVMEKPTKITSNNNGDQDAKKEYYRRWR